MARNVSDQDFNFRPQPPRREAKTFEPPPWEKDQFERLAKERSAQEVAERAAAEVLIERHPQEAAAEPAESAASVEAPAGAADADAEGAASAGPLTQPTPEVPAAPSPTLAGGQIDEAQLAVMMMGLRAEEPPALGGAWVIALVSAIVMGAVGIVLLIWGIVALTRPNMGAIGTMGGTALLLFGLIFMGACIWLGLRTLRQRGVL